MIALGLSVSPSSFSFSLSLSLPLFLSLLPIQGWLNEMRKRRGDLLSAKSRRHQRRAEMAKRHSAEAQKRMKIITELAKGGGNVK